MKQNWKTSVFGLILAIGSYLAGQPGKAQQIGQLMQVGGAAAVGVFAKDANNNSQPPAK